MVWHGVVWHGVVWRGMAWHGVVWRGARHCGMVQDQLPAFRNGDTLVSLDQLEVSEADDN